MSDRLQGQISRLGVSRETVERLEIYASLIEKWNPRINLVSKSSLKQIWTRHIIDSIQVFRSAPTFGHWVDLGSGGGFPGLVAGILAKEEAPGLRLTLVESDKRKSVFLRTVIREAGLDARVISDRIEIIDPLSADVLSARALADLGTLLFFVERHMRSNGIALFPKGATWQKEVVEARRQWQFAIQPITSLTEPGAAILKISEVSRA